MATEARPVRRRVKGPRSDGARAFDDWLRARNLTVPAFCAARGLDRIAVQHALSGRVRGVALDLAFAIQSGTEGDIAASLWRASTVRWDHDPPVDETTVEALDKASGE